MKKAFTLVELLTVLIIVGILGTLGLAQYGRTIEKSRASEAWDVFSHIRKIAAAYYQEHDTILTITQPELNIGLLANQYPGAVSMACRPTHYFWFRHTTGPGAGVFSITATRCGATGKGGLTQWQTIAISDTMDFASTAADVMVVPAPYQ